MGAKGAAKRNPIFCSILSFPSNSEFSTEWEDAALKQKDPCVISVYLYSAQHAGFRNIHNVHIRDWPWPQLLSILNVSSPDFGSRWTSPSHCLCAYNSQIMSSSKMYSQCCVCIDLQAGLPPHTPHTHIQPHSAPGTNRRLHLVSQTTKSVKCILALLLYSVIDGSKNPAAPVFGYVCLCLIKGLVPAYRSRE